MLFLKPAGNKHAVGLNTGSFLLSFLFARTWRKLFLHRLCRGPQSACSWRGFLWLCRIERGARVETGRDLNCRSLLRLVYFGFNLPLTSFSLSPVQCFRLIKALLVSTRSVSNFISHSPERRVGLARVLECATW